LMRMIELSKLSSKGQVVIPRSLRLKMGLKEGDRLIMFSSGDLIILRKVEGEKSILGALSQFAREKAKKLNIDEKDVSEAVSWARKGH